MCISTSVGCLKLSVLSLVAVLVVFVDVASHRPCGLRLERNEQPLFDEEAARKYVKEHQPSSLKDQLDSEMGDEMLTAHASFGGIDPKMTFIDTLKMGQGRRVSAPDRSVRKKTEGKDLDRLQTRIHNRIKSQSLVRHANRKRQRPIKGEEDDSDNDEGGERNRGRNVGDDDAHTNSSKPQTAELDLGNMRKFTVGRLELAFSYFSHPNCTIFSRSQNCLRIFDKLSWSIDLC